MVYRSHASEHGKVIAFVSIIFLSRNEKNLQQTGRCF